MLVLASSAPALGQTVPSEAPSATPANAPSASEVAADEGGTADLWVYQLDVLTRVDGEGGEVLEQRDVSTAQCTNPSPSASFVRPDGGAVWLRASTSPDQFLGDCFIRVPVDGSEVAAFPITPEPGRAMQLREEWGAAASGDALYFVAVNTKANAQGYDMTDTDLYRLAPDGTVQLVQEQVLGIAPGDPDPVAFWIEGKKRTAGELRMGTLDATEGRLVADGTWAQAKPSFPGKLQAGPAGLVAQHAQYGDAPALVLDSSSGSTVAKAKPPKKADPQYEAYPTPDGTWLEGRLPGNSFRTYLQFVPKEGTPVTVKACDGIEGSCLATLATWTDDAVWVKAGPWNNETYEWDDAAVVYRRYLHGATEPSLDVPASSFLEAIE
jgi:hypothetical protein